MIDALKRTIGFNPARWIANTRRMQALAAAFDTGAAPRNGAPRFGVVVSPWLGTSIPWYSIAVGLLLARNGSQVSFILDDFPFGENTPRFRFVRGCLRSTMRLLRRRFEVIELSGLPAGPAPDADALAAIGRLARLNAVWQLRGEMTEAGRHAYTERVRRQVEASYGRISALLTPGRFDALFVPGGVFGDSGIWVDHARSAGIRVCSYDASGSGAVLLASNGVACQLQDIPAAFRAIRQRCTDDEQEHRFVIDAARTQMDKRREGTDTFAYQVAGGGGADPRFDGAVLVPLNSAWDSAALGLHTVFDGNVAWIVETVRYLLENTSAPVIVRQHPAERLAIARSSDDYGALLRQHFGEQPRLHFIAAEDKINSYELLARAAAVAVYCSTIGVEAAALGKPVVTASNSYYSRLGFVSRADSLPQYHALLQAAVEGRLAPTQAQREDALLCYYITQSCNFHFTPLNPAEFDKWSSQPLAHWHADAKVQMLLRSLQDGVPVALLNHLDRWQQLQSSPAPQAAAA